MGTMFSKYSVFSMLQKLQMPYRSVKGRVWATFVWRCFRDGSTDTSQYTVQIIHYIMLTYLVYVLLRLARFSFILVANVCTPAEGYMG